MTAAHLRRASPAWRDAAQCGPAAPDGGLSRRCPGAATVVAIYRVKTIDDVDLRHGHDSIAHDRAAAITICCAQPDEEPGTSFWTTAYGSLTQTSVSETCFPAVRSQ